MASCYGKGQRSFAYVFNVDWQMVVPGSQRSFASAGACSVTSLGGVQTFGQIARYNGSIVAVQTVEKPSNFQIRKQNLIEMKQVMPFSN